MSFDRVTLRKILAEHGRVVRIVVTKTEGSSPRDVGAAMLIWADGQHGTIGGGELEWQATARARALLKNGGQHVERLALGPSMGQCCGGAVTLFSELFSAQDTENMENTDVFARRIDGPKDMPIAVSRLLETTEGPGNLPTLSIVNGWIIEPIAPGATLVWIYGAGHVGRALVDVITNLPNFVITWIDVAADRFPVAVPKAVTILPATEPQRVLAHAPKDAHHLILTYSHALDLELCHGALNHEFASVGLIGSATKWARFRTRLAALGHAPGEINRITCPIGDPALGKQPEAIALGVAAMLIQKQNQIRKTDRDVQNDRKPRRRKSRTVNT